MGLLASILVWSTLAHASQAASWATDPTLACSGASLVTQAWGEAYLAAFGPKHETAGNKPAPSLRVQASAMDWVGVASERWGLMFTIIELTVVSPWPAQATTPSSAPILPPPPLARHARKVFTRHASTTANTGRPSAASTGKQKVSDRPMVSRTQPLSSRRSVQRCSSTTAKRLSLVRIYLSDTVHVCIARGTSCARNKRYRSPAARAVQTTWRSHKARQVSQRWPARSHTRSMTSRRSVRPL
jgi:hypothetical protein